MTGDNMQVNKAEEIARGEECLKAAEHLLVGGFANDAVSRAYYGAFHYARALLMTLGIEPKTHRGVIQMIGLHFVRTGHLAEEAAKELAQLETYRELSDYHTATQFSEEQAREELSRARRFAETCMPLLK